MSIFGIAADLGMADRFADILGIGSGINTGFTTGLTGLIDRSLAFDVSSVLGPIAAAQDLYAEALAAKVAAWDGIAATAEEMRLAAYPTAVLSRIAGDIMGIQRAELAAVDTNREAVLSLDWITDPLQETSLAFHGSFTDRLKTFEDFNLAAYGPERYRELMATATPVSYLTRGVRHYVETEVGDKWSSIPPASAEAELGYTKLDPMLARIHPDLPGMRQSAWQTLGRVEIEDRLSQASLSMRRVIKLILDLLAPVPVGEEMTFRERFHLLMPGSKEDAKVAASLFDTFNLFGNRIEMVIHVHEIYRHERSLRELMHSVEHMLAFIFTFGGVADRFDA